MSGKVPGRNCDNWLKCRTHKCKNRNNSFDKKCRMGLKVTDWNVEYTGESETRVLLCVRQISLMWEFHTLLFVFLNILVLSAHAARFVITRLRTIPNCANNL